MSSLKIYSPRGEFGDTLLCSVLVPHFLKNEGRTVDVISRFQLPRSVTEKFSDSYTIIEPNGYCDNPEFYCEKDKILGLLRSDKLFRTPPDCIRSVKLPELPKTVDGDYVVLVPTVTGWWGNDPKERRMTGMYLEHWIEIYDYIKSKKLRVVCFATEQGCSEEQAHMMSDHVVWHKDEQSRSSDILAGQLAIMQHAKTSVAIGGAATVSLVFDIPGVGNDPAFFRGDYAIFVPLILQKRTNLDLLGDLDFISKSIGFTANPDPMVANKFVKDSILNGLKKVL